MINTDPIPHRQRTESGDASDGLTIHQLAGRYESLVDVVCAGAKFGSSDSLELRYTDTRNWLAPRVGQVARVLEEHQAINPDKIAMLLERLLASNTLNELLGADEGNLIQRMSWISQALFDAGLED